MDFSGIKAKTIIGGAILALLLAAYGAGRYSAPEKIVVQTKVVEKEVIKKQDNVVTVITEKRNKDGSSEKKTEVIDKSLINSEKDSSIINALKEERKSLDWAVGGIIKPRHDNLLAPAYGITVSKRVIGSIYGGGFITTDGQFGLNAFILF